MTKGPNAQNYVHATCSAIKIPNQQVCFTVLNQLWTVGGGVLLPESCGLNIHRLLHSGADFQALRHGKRVLQNWLEYSRFLSGHSRANRYGHDDMSWPTYNVNSERYFPR